MSIENDRSLRRVYVLTADIAERLSAYQAAMGFKTEVDAVRRLLDDALKARDTPRLIAERMRLKLRDVPVIGEVARDVVAGHPLVMSISFEPDSVSFVLKDGTTVTVKANGAWQAVNRGETIDQWPPKDAHTIDRIP